MCHGRRCTCLHTISYIALRSARIAAGVTPRTTWLGLGLVSARARVRFWARDFELGQVLELG